MSLPDPKHLEKRLRDAGLRIGVPDKVALFDKAARCLNDHGRSAAELRAWFVPGRIEVLGKHTDYCGGRSLVAAVELGICLVAAPRTDGSIRMHALDVADSTAFAWDPDLDVPESGWRNYPMTVARRLARNFPEARRNGADIAFCADLPPAAGMSSSSALIIAMFQALSAIEQIHQTPEYRQHITDDMSLAEYLGTNENGQSYGALAGDRGVGTFGGSEDHTAILCSQSDTLGLFRYCPTRLQQRVPLPEGWCFALGVSGVVAEKTGAAQHSYNQASARVQQLVTTWNISTGENRVYLADILATSPDAGDHLHEAIDKQGGGDADALHQRLRHYELEDALIDATLAALLAGDADGVGEAVAQSQAHAETLLGNQVPETSWLAQSARDCGAVAASAFGAGFGGCVWALTRTDDVADFQRQWAASYHQRFGQRQSASRFLVSGAGPAAFEL